MGGTELLETTMTAKPVQQPWLAWVYLALAVAGGVLPWLSNLEFMRSTARALTWRSSSLWRMPIRPRNPSPVTCS